MPAETHSHHAPVDRVTLEALVIERLVELLGCDADAVRLDARLRADLDADILVLDDLLASLDEDLGERSVALRIDDDDLEDLDTVGDLVECLQHRLNRVEAGPA